jgi:choline oxidase
MTDSLERDVPYPVEPRPAANSSLAHSRARVLGGCSSHNACIALRAPDADLQAWARAAGEGWGPAGTAPASLTTPDGPRRSRRPAA